MAMVVFSLKIAFLFVKLGMPEPKNWKFHENFTRNRQFHAEVPISRIVSRFHDREECTMYISLPDIEWYRQKLINMTEALSLEESLWSTCYGSSGIASRPGGCCLELQVRYCNHLSPAKRTPIALN